MLDKNSGGSRSSTNCDCEIARIYLQLFYGVQVNVFDAAKSNVSAINF